MFTHFATDLKKLIIAQSFPDDYAQITTHITHWLNNRLERYHESDRAYIAQFILGLIANLDNQSVIDKYQHHHQISPILLASIFQATKSYLSDEALADLKQRLQQTSTQPQANALLQQMS